MRDWTQQGLRHVKLHLGHGVEADLRTFDAVAEVGKDLQIAVDAHWAYSTLEALRLGRALDDRGAWFLEAPVAPEDVEGTRALAAHLSTPKAIGETLRNRYQFAHWLQRRAISLAQPDVGRTGITEALVIADIASAAHVPIAPHHSTGLASPSPPACTSQPPCPISPPSEFQPDTFAVANQMVRTPLLRSADTMLLPDGPGLGIDVDEEAVRANAIP